MDFAKVCHSRRESLSINMMCIHTHETIVENCQPTTNRNTTQQLFLKAIALMAPIKEKKAKEDILVWSVGHMVYLNSPVSFHYHFL